LTEYSNVRRRCQDGMAIVFLFFGDVTPAAPVTPAGP
jgi:hypothetical protein